MPHFDPSFSASAKRKTIVRCTLFLLALGVIPRAQATDYTWTGNVSGAWSNAANWSPNGVPGASDNVTVPNTEHVALLDADRTIKDLTINFGRIDLNTHTLTYTGVGAFNDGGVGNGTLAPNSADGITTIVATKFDAPINGSVSGICFNGARFNGGVKITKTGSADDVCQGGNIFNGSLELTIGGAGIISMCQSGADQYNGDLIFNSTGTGAIRFGYGLGTATLAAPYTVSIGSAGFNSGSLSFARFVQQGAGAQTLSVGPDASLGFFIGSVFNGPVTATAGKMAFSVATFNAAASFTKTGVSEDVSNGGCTFNGPVSFTLTGNGQWRLADVSGDTYNAGVQVSNTGTGAIYFGHDGGASTLAAGNTIAVGDGGFANGDLHLMHFSQLGATAQGLALGTGAGLHIGPGSLFGGDLDASAGQLYLAGSIFNGVSSFTKTAAGNNDCAGGNTFNAAVTVRNTSDGDLQLAEVDADRFNGDAGFKRAGNGALTVGFNGDTHFGGDVSTLGSTAPVHFGNGTARTFFEGSGMQHFATDEEFAPEIANLTMATTGDGALVLDGSIQVSNSIAFTNGLIRAQAVSSTGAGLLVLGDGVSVSDAADAHSYVEGFVRKIGSTAFTFPVGREGVYAPIAISAPTQATDHFTAGYMRVDPTELTDANSRDASLHRISTCEYWMLDRTNGTSNVRVTLSYDMARSCGVAHPSQLVVAGWDGGRWKDRGDGGTTGTPTMGQVASAAPVSAFGPFTLAMAQGDDSDPVELLNFTASYQDATVMTEWITLSTTGSDHYEVERTVDGRLFEQVGTLPGAAGGREQRFTLADEQPLRGLSYYRLKQVGVDGAISYSAMVAVYNGIALTDAASVFPNPTFGEATVMVRGLHEGPMTLSVLNAQGREVRNTARTVAAGDMAMPLSLTELPAGVYIVRIAQGDERPQELRLVKQ